MTVFGEFRGIIRVSTPMLKGVNKSSTFFKRSITLSSDTIAPSERLPVLDALIKQYEKEPNFSLEDTAVVYVHHALNTSRNVLHAMYSLGLAPEHVFVLGKRYSTNHAVAEKIKRSGVHYQPSSTQAGAGAFEESFTYDIALLWSEVYNQLKSNKTIKNLLILDHGGYATRFIREEILDKYKVIALEKTSGGLGKWNLPSFPLIDVARCAAKKHLESPFIAEAVLKKLAPVIDMTQEPTECCVIGYGAIGKAIAEKLLTLGHRVVIYDNNPDKLRAVPLGKLITTSSLSSAVNFSKIIFGCSGCDVTAGNMDAFRLAPEKKVLISCSSEDREFLTLLQFIQQKMNGTARRLANAFKDITYTNDFSKDIIILKAGFPYNFDDSGESVPANDIQLTRGLVLAGVLQAAQIFNKCPELTKTGGLYALDTSLQKFIVEEWLKHQPKNRFSSETLACFKDPKWITRNSPGIHAKLNISSQAYVEEEETTTLQLKK